MNHSSPFTKRLALGSAQFGLDYGVANQSGKVTSAEVATILSLANSAGVYMVDTALAYGDSEQSLGRALASTGTGPAFQIVTKLPPGLNGVTVADCVAQSLKNLGTKYVYGCLFHSFQDYVDVPARHADLRAVKSIGLVQKVGFSLYFPQELDELIRNKVPFDLVQIPYNLMDRRFETYLPRLKQLGVEIHIRSVFLQGLLLMDPQKCPTHFDSVRGKLQEFHAQMDGLGVSAVTASIGFALANPFVDRIVFGVDSLNQLKENLALLPDTQGLGAFARSMDSMRCEDLDIILPPRWQTESR